MENQAARSSQTSLSHGSQDEKQAHNDTIARHDIPNAINMGSSGQDFKTGGGKDVIVTDVEKGGLTPMTTLNGEETDSTKKGGKASRFYRKYRIWFHLLFFVIITGWWTAGLGLHHDDKNWVVPFLIWLAVTIRLITFHVPVSIVMKPVHWIWENTGVRFVSYIPEKFRLLAGATLTVAVIMVGAFASEESADNTRENRAISLFGLGVLIFGMWITSRNRKIIVWHTVIVGFLLQFIVALFVLRTQVGYDIFAFISGLARSLLSFARLGVGFLTTPDIAALTFFFFSVLPAIIFFIAIVQILYHWGFLQWAIGKYFKGQRGDFRPHLGSVSIRVKGP